MKAYSLDFFTKDKKTFSIIEEFSTLSPKRKMALCEHLFSNRPLSFQNAVSLIWPQAQENDIEKLNKFITLLKQTAH